MSTRVALSAAAVSLKTSLGVDHVAPGERYSVQNTGTSTVYLGAATASADVSGWHELEPGKTAKVGIYSDWWMRCPRGGEVVASSAASFEIQA